jgi:hypothetical protein
MIGRPKMKEEWASKRVTAERIALRIFIITPKIDDKVDFVLKAQHRRKF